MSSIDVKNTRRLRRTVFVIVGCVLFASVAWTYLMGNAVVASHQAVVQQQALIDDLKDTLSTLKDAETGQRGFLLTGEDPYLQPYTTARALIGKQLTTLDNLARTRGLEPADVQQFKSLVNAKLTELDRTLQLRRNQGLPAAMVEVRADIGKRAMDGLRDLTANMIRKETAELKDLEDRAARLTSYRTLLFAGVTLFNLILIGWAYRRIDREVLQREEIANQVLRQKELLAVTLGSIGDGVIVTDATGNITFLNDVAEKLSGWTTAEAIAQPCSKVFNIINENSRQLVESPVDKVLRLGIVVGLANHTLLIRKDGHEIPIDDSGAPVRDKDGKVQGVVLIFRDFSDHKNAAMELIRSKEAAEEANIAKDNFLATLSHELRTPLTPVVATLTTWETSSDLPASLLSDVQMMRRNIDLEARLIDDLLDLTRIVRGKLSLNPEVADVHQLIRSVASMYQSEVQTKHLRLTMELNAERHFVYADPARLQQVFWNILKNATKFTGDGGHIDLLTTNEASGQVRVTFRDDGIGMKRELLSKLFLPFEQGTDETVRRYGGLGLGLAISKALMDAQGGSISADSAGPGQGSQFTVGLPCVNAPDCTDAPAAPTDVPQQSLRILLVEDHADTARVLSRLLRASGHKIHIAGSLATAIASARENVIDMIISDIGLPDGTGIDLIQEIRKTSHVPAIALTGFGMEEDVAKCISAGFNDHLTKPVNLQKLELVIRKMASQQPVNQVRA